MPVGDVSCKILLTGVRSKHNFEYQHTSDHTGADPIKLVEDLARKKRIRTLGVSMGQGQEIMARNYLTAAIMDGQWLLLQNTHLGLAYLTEVCKVSVLQTDDTICTPV